MNQADPEDLVVSLSLVDSSVPKESVGSTTSVAPAELTDRLEPAPVPRLEPRPVVSEVFAAALALQRAGDVAAAVAAYETLLAGGVPSAQVHNNLGLLYQQQNRFADAEREYQSAMAIDPRHSKAQNNLGVVRMRQARHEEAAAAFRGARGLDPTNLDAWVNLALALREAGDSVAARRTLVDVLSVDARHAPTHYNLARLFEGDGDASRAIEHYGRFVEHSGTEHADLVEMVEHRMAALASR
jgi:tetratricopeptide (TPR) repeat protein